MVHLRFIVVYTVVSYLAEIEFGFVLVEHVLMLGQCYIVVDLRKAAISVYTPLYRHPSSCQCLDKAAACSWQQPVVCQCVFVVMQGSIACPSGQWCTCLPGVNVGLWDKSTVFVNDCAAARPSTLMPCSATCGTSYAWMALHVLGATNLLCPSCTALHQVALLCLALACAIVSFVVKLRGSHVRQVIYQRLLFTSGRS